MPWNLSDDRPVYLQLIEQIERRILSGEYPAGERVLSVRDLSKVAAVNPNTMQRALWELEQRGLIINNKTLGRTITDNRDLIQNIREQLAKEKVESFCMEMKELGFEKKDLISLFK